jgi:hypothetical protein
MRTSSKSLGGGNMKRRINGQISDESYSCKIKRVFASTKITAASNTPKVGIFWIIDDELVAFSDSVDINYNPLAVEDMLHKEVWNEIKERYKVNGRAVGYDYFPRGRVMIYPIKDSNGDFQYYDCSVYGDKCIINDSDVQEEIESEFRLYLKSCKVSYEGQFSIDGTHYTCHNCRK